MGSVYLALVHYPVLNRRGDIVATCITPFDLHDIARSSATYGIKKYFVVQPYPAQHKFAGRFINFWESDAGARYNMTRKVAFENLVLKKDINEVIADIPKPLKIVATTAKKRKNAVSYDALKKKIAGRGNYLILIGTGWGMTEELFAKADYVLKPLEGKTKYNHLSVRSAAAIILDRLLSKK
ncbi:MAG: RNA methyltransferase [bacterium]